MCAWSTKAKCTCIYTDRRWFEEGMEYWNEDGMIGMDWDDRDDRDDWDRLGWDGVS